jgi:hypothetical protein
MKLPSKQRFETNKISMVLNLGTVRILSIGFKDCVFTELTCGFKTWPKYASDPGDRYL